MQDPSTPDSPAIHDEYTGVGGTYLRDPVTGVRTPVTQQPDAPAAVPAEEEQE